MLIASAGSVSLLQGWVPFGVDVFAGIALGCVLLSGRRRDGPLRIWLALVVGLGAALAARWASKTSGISGEIAPWPLWAWIFATGFAVAVAAFGWRRGTGWWRNGAVFASTMCLLSTGLTINGWIGYFPTVTVAWDQLTGQPLPRQINWDTATAMRSHGEQPRDGRVVAVNTGAESSGFHHRAEWVYLPPVWFRNTGAPASAVMMIGGEFATAADWVRAGQAVATADSYAGAHEGVAPILVFVDANGAFTNDTECVNGIRGRAADHLTKDVLPHITNQLGISKDPRHWSVAGFSSGGTCAVDLTVKHPDLFGTFVDIAGDERPNAGTAAQSVERLFGGDRQAWSAFDPVTIINRHGRYTGTSGLFIVPESSNADSDVAQRLCGAGAVKGIRCSVTSLPGRHTWPFAAAAFEAALPWVVAAQGAPSPQVS